MVSDKLNAAIAAIKAGNKAVGLRLLSEIVKSDPNNETAWLWLSTCVNKTEQKKYCLSKALSINPNNQNARRALEQLESPPQPSFEEMSSVSSAKSLPYPSARSSTSSLWCQRRVSDNSWHSFLKRIYAATLNAFSDC